MDHPGHKTATLPQLSLPLVVSLVIVAAVAGGALGYGLSPVYQATMYDKTAMGLGTTDRWLDLRYLVAMISHHRAAMLLAEQAKTESKRPEITGLVDKILADEPKLIEELYTWKRDWYGDSRQVPDPRRINLGKAGDTFDLRFLNALIWHHEEGIRMTTEVRTKSTRTEVLDNADAVENFLKTTLVALKDMREKWYGVK